MSEDEAFIREIVSRPGDDLPRLVYADYLDERSDPRGSYLRAEAEWAKTKQTTGFLVLRLHGLAEALDPVWVARVSRPPEGVCCDHVDFRHQGPPIDDQMIDRFERDVGVTLPAEYRGFLLSYNGGVVIDGELVLPNGEIVDSGMEHVLYSLRAPDSARGGHDLYRSVRAREEYLDRFSTVNIDRIDEATERWFRQWLDIGRSPDEIFGLMLGVSGSNSGQVMYFDYSVGFYPGFLDRVRTAYAKSFSEYLTRLPNTGYP